MEILYLVASQVAFGVAAGLVIERAERILPPRPVEPARAAPDHLARRLASLPTRLDQTIERSLGARFRRTQRGRALRVESGRGLPSKRRAACAQVRNLEARVRRAAQLGDGAAALARGGLE